MNDIKKYFLVVTTLLFVLCAAQAADEKEIVMTYFNHGDSVSLRWGPSSEALFLKSLKTGYLVQRRVYGSSKWTNVSSKLMPASEKQFSVMEALNPDAATVRELLYPSDVRNQSYDDEDEPNGNAQGTISRNKKFEEDILLMMAYYSCSFSLDVAKAAALFFVDKQVDKNATYEYRVIFGDQEKSKKVNVSVVKVEMPVKTVLPTPNDFEGYFEERYVHFQWSVAGFDEYYMGYNVERSTDSVHFEKLRERPFVHTFTNDAFENTAIFRDTFPDKEATYYYRLSGYSPFGFYGPYSKVVKGEPKFNFDAVPIRVDTVVDNKKDVEIRWSFDQKFEKKVKGFRISRTPDYKSFSYENEGFIPADKRSFKINKNFSGSQYFAVIAYGKQEKQEKQSSYYFHFVPDTIPPAIPTGLKAEIDSAGVTTISWNPNTDSDIVGYQLFYSNSGDEMDFFNVTDTIYPYTTYVDTLPLNTLTNVAYYRVNAIDKCYNRSHWSEPVKVIKPDTIPPVPVVFHFLQQPKEKMVVEWDNSPSDDLDHMELYRQIDDTGKLQLVKRFDLKKKRVPTSFEDDYSYSGEQVSYSMVVYDEAGNSSVSHSNYFKAKGKRVGCIGDLKLNLVVTEREKKVVLNWKVMSKVTIDKYVIYRKKDDGPMLDIGAAKSSQLLYEDDRIAVGAVYRYIVRAVSSERMCPAVYSDPIEIKGNRTRK